MNDFNSIDKLVEFGLSIAVAQQMIKTVNHAIGNMAVPGVGNPMPENVRRYYAVIDNVQAGPFLQQEIADMIRTRKIHGKSLVWTPGMSAWTMADSVAEVNRLLLLNPPEVQ